MNIQVTRDSILKQIQEDFNRSFPFLWINFLYDTTTQTKLFKSGNMQLDSPLKNQSDFTGIKTINIDGGNTVSELENDFWVTLHLATKVMRKSGKVWVATSYTSNWTLDIQNFEGGQIVID